MERLTARRALALAATAGALTLTGCGGDDSEDAPPTADVNYTRGLAGAEREVAIAIEGYWEAFLAGDSDRICEFTSRPGDDLERCRDTLPDFTLRKQPEHELRNLRLRGERATARLVPVSGKGEPVLMQLRRIEDRWQVLAVSLPLG